MPKWTAANIPDQTGRTIIVTGATSGLGYETALALAAKGANVTLAVRSVSRGAATRDRIVAAHPSAKVNVDDLDLADLSNVRAFAARWQGKPLDVLINNAGIMAVPYATTKDGFESQMGTNLLGHFVLTDGLLDSLLATTAPRVVTVSSMVHKSGKLETGSAVELIAKPDNYKTWTVYSNSKLADLLFALELNRRAQRAHSPLISVAAHPGYAATNLQGGPGKAGGLRGAISDVFMKIGNAVLGQSAANGALPQLYAATMPDVVGGEYFGPDGPAEQRGGPKRVNPSKRALDPELARKVWATTVELTGADFSELGG